VGSTKLTANSLFNNKSEVPFEFNRVAKKYDVATFLSQGYQKDLQRSVDRLNLIGDEKVLDLCCGTGKSTICCVNNLPNGKVIGIDNSEVMLKVAEEKYYHRYDRNKLEFLKKDVMELDYDDNSVDAIFMAYGIRNMPDYKKALDNLFRTLKPGGKIAFHEYSLNNNLISHLYWKMLGYFVVIPVSTIISGSSTIFKYLVKSVDEFLSPNEFTNLLTETGFTDVKEHYMPTWRKPILRTFTATKPGENK
jgi:ubiquinone/menaquinone biosynthesis methyltransferase